MALVRGHLVPVRLLQFRWRDQKNRAGYGIHCTAAPRDDRMMRLAAGRNYFGIIDLQQPKLIAIQLVCHAFELAPERRKLHPLLLQRPI